MTQGEHDMGNGEIDNKGLANWTGRLDARVTRLEERGVHVDANGQRLERLVEKLADRLTMESERTNAKVEAESRSVRTTVNRLLFSVLGLFLAILGGIIVQIVLRAFGS